MSDTYRCLVVDDEDFSRKLVMQLLSDAGIEPLQASSGEECLEVVETLKPDLILLDIVMPEMDGLEVCRQLKSSEKMGHIPVIFLTSMDSREDILNGFEAGGTDYISKPVDKKILIARVQALLTIQGLVKEKENLLKMNQVLLEKLENILGEVELTEKLDFIKNEVSTVSEKMFSEFDNLRAIIDKSVASLNEVELSFQFTDRLHQQINEISRVVTKLHYVMKKDATPKDLRACINKESSPSVFKKMDQQKIDDLLNSLK